jgi:hypothetical protein
MNSGEIDMHGLAATREEPASGVEQRPQCLAPGRGLDLVLRDWFCCLVWRGLGAGGAAGRRSLMQRVLLTCPAA